MGSRFAALYAGYVPKTTPTKTQSNNPIITQSYGIAALALRKLPAKFPILIPSKIPISPPIRQSVTASIKNCRRIFAGKKQPRIGKKIWCAFTHYLQMHKKIWQN